MFGLVLFHDYTTIRADLVDYLRDGCSGNIWPIRYGDHTWRYLLHLLYEELIRANSYRVQAAVLAKGRTKQDCWGAQHAGAWKFREIESIGAA